MKIAIPVSLFCTILFTYYSALAQKKEHIEPHKSIQLRIKLDGALPTDTFHVAFYEQFLDEKAWPYLNYISAQAGIGADGYFSFNIPTTRPGYIYLGKDKSQLFSNQIVYLLNTYLSEPGDNVKIYIKNGNIPNPLFNPPYCSMPEYSLKTILFLGKGAKKFECRYLVDSTVSSPGSYNKSYKGKLQGLLADPYLEQADSLALAKWKKYKGQVSSFAYDVLRADLISNIEKDRVKSRLYKVLDLKRDSISSNLDPFKQDIFSYDRYIAGQIGPINSAAKSFSAYYLGFLYKKGLLQEYAKKTSKESDIYSLFKRHFNGETRDKLLTIYFFEYYQRINDPQALLDEALTLVTTPFCRQQLTNIASSEQVGKPAYNFSLIDTNGTVVRLSDFKGKVVFIDFWYTGCTACSAYYLYSLLPIENEFRNDTNIAFITINIDSDREMWKNSIRRKVFTSPDINNLNTAGKGSDDDVIKSYRVHAYPRPLLIDRNGNIFSSSDTELRRNQVDGLRKKIKEALNYRG